MRDGETEEEKIIYEAIEKHEWDIPVTKDMKEFVKHVKLMGFYEGMKTCWKDNPVGRY